MSQNRRSTGLMFKEVHNGDPELEKALEIYEECFSGSPISIPAETLHEALMRKSGGPRIAVLTEQTVIAMAVFSRFDKGSIIWYLAVMREARRKGYGSLMVRSIADVLKEEVQPGPSAFLYAEFDGELAPFWESNGFRVLPVRYFQPPIAGTWVSLKLGAKALYFPSKLTGKAVEEFVREIYTEVYRVKELNEEHARTTLNDCLNMNEIMFISPHRT
ncbi:MAG: GNAT family N-acetyltransferase [Thermoprotei archaeon]